MKKFLSLFLTLSLFLSLVACGNKQVSNDASDNQDNQTAVATTNDKSADKIVKIGVFEPQTGENGGGGIQEVYGIRYANKIYPTVNINGEEYKVVLDEVDNKSDKTEAVNAAQKLMADRVNVVIGSYGSGVSIAAGETFKDAKVPAIGCSCTNPQVTNGNEYYFRTCFLDPFQGKVMAHYVKNSGFSKVAVITQIGDDYSEGLGGFFVKECKEIGIEVATQERFQTNEQDFKAILTNIKEKDVEFIFAPSSITTAPLILSQARDLGIEAQFGGGDTWENGTIIENAHGAAEGMVVTTFYEADPESAEGEEDIFLNGNGDLTGISDYLVKVEKQPKDIPAVTALGYDAYLSAIKAIEAAGSTNGEEIKNALKNLDFDGVTGNITFNADGDANKDAAYIKVVEDGKFVFQEKTSINE